ncbi:MAG: entF [Myxococcales bacterium]|nr:entF [Myxococcales bacterium]
MRILHTHNAPYYPATLGGSQVADRGLLEMLVSKGHTVRSVCTASMNDKNLKFSGERRREDWLADLHALGGAIVRSDDQVEVMTLGGVEVHSVKTVLPTYLADEIRRFDPERVLFGQYGSGDSVLRTVVETCADRSLFLAHGVMGQPFGPFTVFPSEDKTALLRRVRGVLAASQFVVDYFERFAAIKATRFYFPAYGPGPFPQLGTRRGPVTMVHPSQVKGTAIVRGLAAAMPDLQFVVISSYSTMPADIEVLEVLPNVEIRLGSPSPDQFLSGASALLFPTLGWEAFGLIVIEAMLRGVPVLAADLAGLRESSVGAATLLPVRPLEIDPTVDATGRRHFTVPAQDVAPWREALRELLSHADRYDRLALEGRERAHAFVNRINAEAAHLADALFLGES